MDKLLSKVLVILIFAVSVVGAEQTTFFRSYPLSGNDYFIDVIELPVGGYAVVGASSQYGRLFLRMNEFGDIVTMVHDFPFGDISSDMLLFDNETLMITGYNWQEVFPNIGFMTFDGDSLYTWEYPSFPFLEVREILETSDGGYVMVGYEGNKDSEYTFAMEQSRYVDSFTIKLDSEGNVQWVTDIGCNIGESIIQLADNSYIVLSLLYGFFTVSSDGSEYQPLCGYNGDSGSKVLGLESSFIGIGSPRICEYSYNGNMLWSYWPDYLDEPLYFCGTLGHNGEIIGAGGYWNTSSATGPLLTAVDQDGNMLWEYTGNCDERANIRSIYPTSDGGYICCGGIGEEPYLDGFLLKTDSIGSFPFLGIEGDAFQEYENVILGCYPSPCSGMFTIGYCLPNEGRVRIEIFDLNGRMLASPVDGVLQAGESSVDVEGLSTGLYLIRMEYEGSAISTRQVVIR